MERGGGERLVAVGADGARGGWAVACLYEAGTRLTLGGDITAIARLRVASAAPVAIDVPIGLPARGGPRPCDVAARRLLGRRASTVFAPPARYLLAAAGDYAAMRALAARERLTNPAAAGLSAQSAGIARKVREVDAWVRAHPDSERWLFETHPELDFLALNAGRPLESKRSPAGARRRLELVSAEFPDAAEQIADAAEQIAAAAEQIADAAEQMAAAAEQIADAAEQIAAAPGRGRLAGPSDWLDAYAALTAAVAVARAEHVSLGAERDAEGVPMRIVRPAVRPQISSFEQ